MNKKRSHMKRFLTAVLAMLMIAATLSASVLAADAKEMKYTDVKKTWYYPAVVYTFEKGLMTGLDEYHFGPETNITRAMFATVLYRMADEPYVYTDEVPFPDVPNKPDSWYFAPIVWVKEAGVASGYATGNFGWKDYIIRQDFIKMLKGYADYIGVELPVKVEESYTVKADANKVSKYARKYVEWGFKSGLIGVNSDLKPLDFITRAEAAMIIMRFEEAVEEAYSKQLVASGDCGYSYSETEGFAYTDAAKWELYKDGTLYIRGNGQIMQRKYPISDNYYLDYADEIKHVVIEEGITGAGEYSEQLFKNLYYLEDVTLPNSYDHIAYREFVMCESLGSIVVPKNTTSIGKEAFLYCTDLEKVNIKGAASVGEKAFDETAFVNNDANWDGDLLYSGVNLLKVKKDSTGEVNVKQGTKTIADYAFNQCESITKVTLPEGLISIGNSAFTECSNLNTVIIPSTVKSIGERAFSSCGRLWSITLPAGLKSIEQATFLSCRSLGTLTIPQSVTKIGGMAFYGCSGLGSMVIPDSVTSIGTSAFGE